MTQPPQGYSPDPGYLPPPYPPGQEPIPPREPRRSSPIIAPVLAFVALLLVAVVSYGAINYLDTNLESAAAEASAEPDEEPVEPEVTEEPTEEPEPTEDTGQEPTPTEEVAEEPTEEPEPETTAEPILVVPPSDERADIPGTLLFTRLGGDIWAASGSTLDNFTDSSST